MSVLPPATLEGWYALHQVFALDWAALHGLDATVRERLVADARELLGELAQPGVPGWSAFYQLVGGGAGTLFIHFRETPEAWPTRSSASVARRSGPTSASSTTTRR